MRKTTGKRKKSKNGERQIRLCKCGCGKRVREFYRDGKFNGYGLLAPGCKPQHTEAFKKKISNLMKGPSGLNSVPSGSRHKSFSSKGKAYWRVKMENGTWVFEHRHIMEKKLGRELEKREIVHHINGDSLDNHPDNLTLLSMSEHKRAHVYPKCEKCGWRHPPH